MNKDLVVKNVFYEASLIEFCEELNLYLMTRYKYKKKHAYISRRNTIRADRKYFNIYLRFKPHKNIGWGDNCLVIASIGFFKVHCGNGTSFLKFLLDVADKYCFTSIGIETASTEAIFGFATKYEFKDIKDGDNWIAPVNSLKQRLLNPN
jgi:hypothetical protein